MAASDAKFVQLHPRDTVVVAIEPLAEGGELSTGRGTIRLKTAIRPGHKIATVDTPRGGEVRKYGEIIGLATAKIEAGEWVHSHNLELGDYAKDYAPSQAVPEPLAAIGGRTFQGYRRASGRAGTRNYLAVISTVNCSATVCKYVAEHFTRERLAAFPNVDGVLAFVHAGGCGMQFAGLGHAALNRALGGMARHPNIAGYLLIGLGCEQGAMGYLLDQEGLVQLNGSGGRRGPPVLSMQDAGGTTKTVEAAVKLIGEQLLPAANRHRRETIPASEIVLATKCGGSDGNSGITANPALGVAADMIVACGGTAVLAETTEIYGAEHLLTRRAVRPEVAEKLLSRIEWWKWYTGVFGASIDGNPSVGNKEGGLTTIAEKSLGAVTKAGTTALVDVVQYAEPITAKGLVVMDTPGYDPVAVTGMVCGGANVVVFTTGRGSCFGSRGAPSIKVSTNTPIYERMSADMDLDAGGILRGRSVPEVGQEIFEEILAVASGKRTKSEQLGYGGEEFMPWLIGPTL